jgi:hypothetical protein
VPVFQDFQQVTTMLSGQVGKPPVIEYQELRFGERGQEFGVSTVALRTLVIPIIGSGFIRSSDLPNAMCPIVSL